MAPSEFRERRGADNHALAAMGLTACAILAAVLSIPFALVGGSSWGRSWAEMLVTISAFTGLLVYVRHLPGVVRRLLRAVRSPFTSSAESETGPFVLLVELVGTVLAGVGLVGVALFFEACSRIGKCVSMADLLGVAAPFGLYRWAAVAVFYTGGAILAFGWVAEGLAVTADRSGDDSSNQLP